MTAGTGVNANLHANLKPDCIVMILSTRLSRYPIRGGMSFSSDKRAARLDKTIARDGIESAHLATDGNRAISNGRASARKINGPIEPVRDYKSG